VLVYEPVLEGRLVPLELSSTNTHTSSGCGSAAAGACSKGAPSGGVADAAPAPAAPTAPSALSGASSWQHLAPGGASGGEGPDAAGAAGNGHPPPAAAAGTPEELLPALRRRNAAKPPANGGGAAAAPPAGGQPGKAASQAAAAARRARRGRRAAAVCATFVFSGLWHVFIWHHHRVGGTGLCWLTFFSLQGPILVAEAALKGLWLRRWGLPPLPRWVSVPLTNFLLILIASELWPRGAGEGGGRQEHAWLAAPAAHSP
jgi:hypothetical protein